MPPLLILDARRPRTIILHCPLNLKRLAGANYTEKMEGSESAMYPSGFPQEMSGNLKIDVLCADCICDSVSFFSGTRFG